MPYASHIEYNTPENEVVIWRYMNSEKFKSLLKSSGIYFNRLDQFDDELEGRFNPIDRNSKEAKERTDEQNNLIDTLLIQSRLLSFVSCWHMNERESAKMWEFYGKDEKGIAIKSNIGRFISAIDSSSHIINIGKVKYAKTQDSSENLFSAINLKTKGFVHENEVRAVITNWGMDKNQPPPLGIIETVNLTDLIEAIYVAPTSTSESVLAIQDLLSKSGLNIPVKKSEVIV